MCEFSVSECGVGSEEKIKCHDDPVALQRGEKRKRDTHEDGERKKRLIVVPEVDLGAGAGIDDGGDSGDGGPPSPSASLLGRIQHCRAEDKEDEEVNLLLSKRHVWCVSKLPSNLECVVDMNDFCEQLVSVRNAKCSRKGSCQKGCTLACKRFLCYTIAKDKLKLKWVRQKLPVCVMLAISSLYGKSETGFIKRI